MSKTEQTCEYCGTTIVDTTYWLRLSSGPGVRVFCDDCITGPEREIKSMHAFYKNRVSRLEAENRDLVKRLGDINLNTPRPAMRDGAHVIIDGVHYTIKRWGDEQ